MTYAHPWRPADHPLKFTLSYLTLARRHLPLMMCEYAADTRPEEVPLPPSEPLAAGTVGYLLRGVPLEATRPTFETRGDYLLYTPHQYQRCHVDLSGDFAAYLQRFSARTRSTLRRKVRKFEEFSGGEIDFRVYRSAAELTGFHAPALAVSRRSYQAQVLDAGLPEGEDFRAEVQALADADRVRAFVLFHAGRPVSYLYLRAVDGVLLYEYLGYDPDYARWSIGVVLHWLALQALFAEQRFGLLDFTEGGGQQKRQFSSGQRLCANVYCVPRTLSMRLLLGSHALLNRGSRGLARLLQRYGGYQRLRAVLRRGG